MHGNANKLYTIAGANQAGTSTSQVLIPVTSFNDPAFELSVKRLPGQENLELSDFEEPSGSKSSDSGGLWNSFFGDKAENEEEESAKGETIHVFSLASGHLYERFLKIMMQSVIRSTKSPVKFWFLENFASPQFKEFVPLMAKELGYEVLPLVEIILYRVHQAGDLLFSTRFSRWSS
jgi:UDP-glucose:glycoprotein glucosyltransferase